MSASIGIAVFKPHFPLYSAHHLAEQLIGAAKSAGKDAVVEPRVDDLPSTIDIHVLADSVFTDLDAIRARRTTTMPAEGEHTVVELWGGPYLVGDTETDPEIAQRFRKATWLRAQLSEINSVDENGERRIARRGLHRLRYALADSVPSAVRALAELRDIPADLDVVGGSGKCLVATHPRGAAASSSADRLKSDQSERHSNALLDLLDFVDILAQKPAKDRKQKPVEDRR